jgi:cullin 4
LVVSLLVDSKEEGASSLARVTAARCNAIFSPPFAENDTVAAADEPLERSWPALKDFLAAVHGATYTQHSFQELYNAVESLVLAKQGAKLYERLLAACEGHIASLVSAFVGLPHDARIFLSAVQKTWLSHSSQMVMIRNVFLYLDRTFVRDTVGTKSIW